MSSTTDKIEGIGNQIAGRAKQAAGDLAGKPSLRQEGLAQENVGVAQNAIGDAKAAVKKVIDNA
jgi:uncharacterized protein YjbJ (UPF0337 family)